ncbi:MAG: diaminopimelate epimerase [Victivallaceae bacterium]|nr:diaminopimelate epimerase [Victivallaceae bacterium]
MKFSKWHGLGNDFVLVNTFEENVYDECELAKVVCDRHFGIGADGLVLMGPSDTCTVQMRIVNSDGSRAEMCGNAIRCVARYLADHKMISGDELSVETLGGVVHPRLLPDGRVSVNMGRPRLKRGDIPMLGDPDSEALNVPLVVNGVQWIGTAVSMGNPHFVIFVESLAQIDISQWGPLIENHKSFPKKANVEFVQRLGATRLRMKVWERGCGITMACGTGSCATAVAAVLTQRTGSDMTVILDGGELDIHYDGGDVIMVGPATEVFTGNWS